MDKFGWWVRGLAPVAHKTRCHPGLDPGSISRCCHSRKVGCAGDLAAWGEISRWAPACAGVTSGVWWVGARAGRLASAGSSGRARG